MAAEATLALSCATGSLLHMLQLPRAVYCRGVQLPQVPLAPRLYGLLTLALTPTLTPTLTATPTPTPTQP